jgi:hypothetical protein
MFGAKTVDYTEVIVVVSSGCFPGPLNGVGEATGRGVGDLRLSPLF